MLRCKQCEFEGETAGAIASHVLWTHRSIEKVECERCKRIMLVTQKRRHDAACVRRHSCKQCGALSKNANFCSQSCSASFNNSAKKIGFSAWRRKHAIVATPTYADVCLQYWPAVCAICGWELCIEIHHIDRDRKNNDPQNLIPLCPNHHKLTQKRAFRAWIDVEVDELIKKKFPAPIT